MTLITNKLISYDDRILVAGAKGMVGSSICKTLKLKGYRNILSPSRKDLDYTNFNNLNNWFSDNLPDVVIIASAKVGGIKANNDFPSDFILSNLKIQTNLIELSWKYKVKRLLFLGSSCIYPKFANQPIKEEALLTGSLETTNQWYAIAKIAGIKLCEALRYQHGFDAICLMPTNLYGPGDNYNFEESHVLPAMLRRFDEAKLCGLDAVTCWGTGSPYREFLYVDDLSDACIFALENWDPNSILGPKDKDGNPLIFLNVGTGQDITIKNLAEKIAFTVGFEGEILWDSSKKDGTPRKLLDVSHFKSLGWQSETSFSDGIKITYESYKYEIKNQTIRI